MAETYTSRTAIAFVIIHHNIFGETALLNARTVFVYVVVETFPSHGSPFSTIFRFQNYINN